MVNVFDINIKIVLLVSTRGLFYFFFLSGGLGLSAKDFFKIDRCKVPIKRNKSQLSSMQMIRIG